MAPGGAATLDHTRLAPHAPGKIVKLQFRSVVSGLGATSAAQSFDLSTRCDTAAYALILTGTGAREDRYDPMVFGVTGAEEECVLPSSPTAAGASSKVAPPNTFNPNPDPNPNPNPNRNRNPNRNPNRDPNPKRNPKVALLNTAPSAEQPAFQWGSSLLTLSYQSSAMGLGELLLLDLPVGVGSVYARLVHPAPPHAPLTVARAVDVLPQQRNVLLALAAPNTSASDRDSVTPQAWSLLSAQEAAPPMAGGTVRVLLVNGLGAGEGGPGAGEADLTVAGVSGGGASSVGTGGGGMHSLAPLVANMSGVHTTCLAAGPNMSCPAVHTAAHWLDVPVADAPSVSVSLSSEVSVRLGEQLPGGACAQSLQLVALLGASRNTTPGVDARGAPLAFAPRLLHVDLSGGECHVPSLSIPAVVVPEPRVTPTPFPIANYDITGMGAGAFEGLLEDADSQESAARRARGGAHEGLVGLFALGITACWVLAGERRHTSTL